MLNIVIPMAGAGSRFSKAGYKTPKPLIPIHGTPMIQLVIENLRPKCPHQFIFICQKVHVDAYNLRSLLSKWAPNSRLVVIDALTEGAASTVLSAKSLINNNQPLMIANSDQYVSTDINEYLSRCEHDQQDGLIMTMCASDPKWSFVGLNHQKLVTHVTEKKVISNEATVGVYNFKHGSSFVSAATAMIQNNERVMGEYYVAPVYNKLISDGHKIGVYNIGTVGNGMYGLGTPADLEYFLTLPMSHQESAVS